ITTASFQKGEILLDVDFDYARVADINGDGKSDIITQKGKKVIIYLNTSKLGTVSLSGKKEITAVGDGVEVSSITDMDNDGKPDLIVTIRYSQPDSGGWPVESIYKQSILLNTTPAGGQTPTFSGNYEITSGSIYTAFISKFGDIDGDGRADLISFKKVSLNQSTPGNLQFAAETTMGSLDNFVIADIDLDGKNDIIETGTTRIRIFHNISTSGTINTSSFETPISLPHPINLEGSGIIFLSDIDGDGRLDIWLTNPGPQYTNHPVLVYRNNTTPGSITSTSLSQNFDMVPLFKFPTGVGITNIADIDGDGKSDLITQNYSNSVGGFNVMQYHIIKTSASAPSIVSFSPLSGQAGTVITINGTNFGAGASNNIVRFENGLKGTITNATETTITVTAPAGAMTGNLSVLNISTGLVTKSKNAFKALVPKVTLLPTTFMEPQVKFNLSTIFGEGFSFTDLNDDGKTDLISFSHNKNAEFIKNISSPGLINTSSFAPPVPLFPDANKALINFVDWNGDGKQDIVYTLQTQSSVGNIYIRFNLSANGGEPVFSAPTTLLAADGSNNEILGVNDIDGDGKQDIYLKNTYYEKIYPSIFSSVCCKLGL
ncbi:MAG: hypothetical protein EOO98_02535, partial [Pedobacter sp.]